MTPPPGKHSLLLPASYLLLAFGAALVLVAGGLVSDRLGALLDSPPRSNLIRALIAAPMPFAFALAIGVGWRAAAAMAAILISTVALLPHPNTINVALLACALALLLFRGQDQEHAPTGAAPNTLPWALAFAALGCGLRLLTLNEPFERDLMAYATVAAGWLDGLRLYADVWDHKPPGLYVIYAAAIGPLGQTPLAMWAIGCSFYVFTLFGIRQVAHQIAGHRAAIAAMALWAVTAADPLIQANQPNAEVAMNACLIWAVAALLPPQNGGPVPWLRVLGAGALFFMATSIKQIAIFPAVLAGLWLVLSTGLLRPDHRLSVTTLFNSGLSRALVLGLVAALGWVGIFLAFQSAGTFDAFYGAVFGYNQSYSGSILINLIKSFVGLPPLIYPAAFFLLLGWHVSRAKEPPHALLVLLYLGVFLMVAAPGRFYQHYFQLMLPFIAVSGGWLLASIVPKGRMLLALLVLLAPVWVSFGYFTDGERVAFVKYNKDKHGAEAVQSRQVGHWLAENVASDARVLHWGAEPGIFFWSGRAPDYRYIFNFPLIEGPLASQLAESYADELEAAPPDLAIVKVVPKAQQTGPIWRFLKSRYEVSDDFADVSKFELWIPKE